MNQRKNIATGLIILIIGVVAFLVGLLIWNASPGFNADVARERHQEGLVVLGLAGVMVGVVLFAIGGIIAAASYAKDKK